jgi:DNA replication protein DnaC
MSESSSSVVVGLQEGAIKQHCKLLHLPTIATQCASLAEQAERERQGYLGYLDVLLQAELEEREQKTIIRRL